MENVKNFKKPYDDVLFVYSVLKRLGCGKVDRFLDRLRSQKVQYLAQVFGVSPCYLFNLYLWGPYSPDLANDLFKINERKNQIKQPKDDEFVPEELEERFIKLNNFIRGKSDRQLELIATLHWLLKVARLSRVIAKKEMVRLKNVSEKELNETFEFVELI